MFEIGNTLREARARQELELHQVEADTKIRAKYLRALEDERFDVLPGEAYAKGFLRTYADYLGLDGQLYVEEYKWRFAVAEEPVPPLGNARRAAPTTVDSRFAALAVAGVLAIGVLAVAAWKFGGPLGRSTTLRTQSAAKATPTLTAAAEKKPRQATRRKAPTAMLVLTAARGDSWLSARAGSTTAACSTRGRSSEVSRSAWPGSVFGSGSARRATST